MMDKGYKGVFSKMGEGLLEKFIEDLKRELQERPEDSELLFKLGVAYSRAGKVEEAREVRSIHHSWKESSILTMPHLYP